LAWGVLAGGAAAGLATDDSADSGSVQCAAVVFDADRAVNWGAMSEAGIIVDAASGRNVGPIAGDNSPAGLSAVEGIKSAADGNAAF
jgi:hypothetical protein